MTYYSSEVPCPNVSLTKLYALARFVGKKFGGIIGIREAGRIID
jgi:hypothetical protein